jgi:hypothetical protein
MKELAHEHWDNENHFTQWVAGNAKEPRFEPEVPNITYLESALDFYITENEAEVDIGTYSLDNRIEGVNANETYTAVIENQFRVERSKNQHSHLGKLLLYASGLDADIVVWIVAESPSDKHLQTIQWLNDTKQNVIFLAFEIEVLSLNGTQAPYFEKISGPDNWSETELPERDTRSRRLEKFWTVLDNRIRERNSEFLRTHKPKEKNTHSQMRTIDINGVGVRFRTDRNQSCVKIEFAIESGDSKTLFNHLEGRKTEIQDQLNANHDLEWTEPAEEGHKGKAVLKRYGFDLSDVQEWDLFHGWLITKGEQVVEVFSGHIHECDME